MIQPAQRSDEVLVVAEGGEALPSPERTDWRMPAFKLVQHSLFLVLVFGLWEAVSEFVVGPFWISKPSLIAGVLMKWVMGSEFWRHFAVTLTEVGYGFGLGVAGGVLAGFVLGELPRLGRFLDPYLAALYGIPKTALAPLFILWFGIGLGAKVAMAAIMVFFLVFFNTAAGLRSVERDLINMARVAGASRGQILGKIKLPFAFPYIITGVKLGLPTGLIGAIVAEFISSNQGIGYVIVRASMFFDTASVFAGVIVLAVTVFALNEVLVRIERHVLRWRPEAP
jgi:NitT/TauT family transport system permease protein